MGDGLHTTLAVTAAPQDSSRESWNCTRERGIIEARPGFAVIQRFDASDCKVHGLAYAEYSGVREWVSIVTLPGDTNASLIVLTEDSDGSWALDQDTYMVEQIQPSSWLFAQFGQYLYAVNETAGLYRRLVGATTGSGVWQKVNTRYRYNVVGSVSTDTFDNRLWDAATDTEEIYAPQTFSVNDASTVNADGSWTIEQTDDRGNQVSAYAFWVCTFSAGQDFGDERYLTLTVSLEYDALDVRPHENPVFRVNVPNEEPMVWLSANASAAVPSTSTFKSAWSGWTAARVYDVEVDRDTLTLTIDLDAAAAAGLDITSVRRFALGISIRAGNPYSAHLSPIRKGGTFMNKPRTGAYMTVDPSSSYSTELKEIEYAVQYFNSSTSAESSATILNLAIEEGYGLPAWPGLIPRGARAVVEWQEGTGANAPANFDQVRVWRKRHSDEGRWWLIHTGTNADGSIEDGRVDDLSDSIAWVAGTPTKRESSNDFSSVDQALLPQAIATWKGHVVLGVKQEVYLSYGGSPELYVPPTRDNPQFFDSDDPTMGRTLFMAQDASDQCIGAVADDLLYLIGLRGIYVMVGDSALDATPPRLLAGSKGAFGTRAFCKYQGGILAANEEGLYWHRGARALAAGSDSLYEFENLTAGIEPTWKEFTSDSGRNGLMVVREWMGEIYVVLDSKFLMRTRSGKWLRGNWNRSALTGVAYSGDGGAELDDNGVPYEDDPGDGEPFPAGPYQDPNDLPESEVPNPIHGVSDIWPVGIWYPPYNIRPGTDTGWGVAQVSQLREPLTPEAEPTGRIVDLVGAEKLGLRAVAYGGSFIQMARNMNGVAYQNDNGYPIEWVWQGQAYTLDGVRRGFARMLLDHSNVKETAQPLRIIVTTRDGTNGLSQQFWDFSDLKRIPDQKKLGPGHRFDVIVAGRSASRRLETLELQWEPERTSGV